MIEKIFWSIEINRIEYKWNILLSCQLKSNLLSTQSKVPIQASTVRFEFVPYRTRTLSRRPDCEDANAGGIKKTSACHCFICIRH